MQHEYFTSFCLLYIIKAEEKPHHKGGSDMTSLTLNNGISMPQQGLGVFQIPDAA